MSYTGKRIQDVFRECVLQDVRYSLVDGDPEVRELNLWCLNVGVMQSALEILNGESVAARPEYETNRISDFPMIVIDDPIAILGFEQKFQRYIPHTVETRGVLDGEELDRAVDEISDTLSLRARDRRDKT